MLLGLISDTHGLLRPEVLRVFVGTDFILHAGDIGGNAPEILAQLQQLAPTIAVRGNTDFHDCKLNNFELVTLAGTQIYLHHGNDESLDFLPAGTQIVITGHTHQPKISRNSAGTLFINPGSAGPRRFSLPISVALCKISPDSAPRAKIIYLD